MNIKASEIEKAVDEQCNGFYPMSLVGEGVPAVIRCVNLGIDSHLEACYIEGVDSYAWEDRKTASGKVHTRALSCTVSARSMAVLLRRLCDDGPGIDEEEMWDGPRLASDILGTLGFEDLDVGSFEVTSRVDEGLLGQEQLSLTEGGAVKRVEV